MRRLPTLDDDPRPPNAIALIFALSVIVLVPMVYFGIETYAKYLGGSVDAVVVMPPTNCDSSPYVLVDADNRSFELFISHEECISGEYVRGKIVKVKMHPYRNELVSQEKHPEFIFLPMFILIGGGAVITAFSKT